MPTTDPIERLRLVNPVPLAELARSRPDPVLFREITSRAPTSAPGTAVTRARRRRRAGRLVPALLATSMLGGAVAYGVLREGVSKPQTVACYERADLEANAAVVVVDGRGPLAACADMWRRGGFGGGGFGGGGFGGGGEVPALALCVLSSGVAGVFPTTPGQDVCTHLSLPSVVPGTLPPRPGSQPPADVNDRVLAFRDAVFAQVVDLVCLEPQAGAVIVRRELERAGLADWTVRGGEGVAGDGFSPERPCATLSLRPERREVVLVPSPPRR